MDEGTVENFEISSQPRFQGFFLGLGKALGTRLRTPKRYQDPVLRVWPKLFFIPKRYQDLVLWAWLEISFTPKRNQS